MKYIDKKIKILKMKISSIKIEVNSKYGSSYNTNKMYDLLDMIFKFKFEIKKLKLQKLRIEKLKRIVK